MKHARIIDDVAIEVIDGEPHGIRHPDLAALYEPVPQKVVVGARRVGGVWQLPPAPEPPAEPAP